MSLSHSKNSRRAILAGGALVLALSLASGLRVSSLAGSLGWYDDQGSGLCDDYDAANPGIPNPTGAATPCWYGAAEDEQVGFDGLPACADDVDNDSDELTDCLDPDCFGKDGCGSGEWCNVESAQFAGQDGDCGDDYGDDKCQDGIDNDSDGLFDCADPDCAYAAGTWSSVCEVVIGDPVCGENTCNAGEFGEEGVSCGGDCSQNNCLDGVDNDDNGSSDCDDYACSYQDVCQSQGPEWDDPSCSDGIDNDSDGYWDCDDPDCDGTETCWWAYSGWNPGNWWDSYEADCSDGADNDNDGYWDCADDDCSGDYLCSSDWGDQTETAPWGYYDEYFCSNGDDDDNDGYWDCDDPDCYGTTVCSTCQAEQSTETDADADCQPDEYYWGSACDDGNDNDFDGLVDCDDDDCASDAVCLVGQAIWEPDGNDWLVGLSCNGTNYGGGCTPEETGYHYRGTFGGAECWWYTKNQAWQTDESTNLYSLATTFGLDPNTGVTSWCHPFGDEPNLQGDDGGAYNDSGYVGSFGWCGGAPMESGGFTCFYPEDTSGNWWDFGSWFSGSCDDSSACNYGAEEDCEYDSCGANYCDDSAACNYGAEGDCEYDSCNSTSCDDSSACNYGAEEDCEYESCADSCGDGSRSGEEECDGTVENGWCDESCQVSCDPGYTARRTIWPFDGAKVVCSAYAVNDGICGESYGSCPNRDYPFDYDYRPELGSDTWKCGSKICP